MTDGMIFSGLIIGASIVVTIVWVLIHRHHLRKSRETLLEVCCRIAYCQGCSKQINESKHETNYCERSCVCLGAVYCTPCWNKHIDRIDEWKRN